MRNPKQNHKQLKNTYSTFAKKWRTSKAERHPDVSTFSQTTFNDPNHDLTLLMKNINSLIIFPKMRQMLWFISTNSLYCGKVAHDYQKNIKNVKDGDPRLTPDHCTYTKYAYQNTYIPQNHKPPPIHVTNSYEHIFWTSHVASLIWSHSRHIAQAMNIDLCVNDWNSIFRMATTS